MDKVIKSFSTIIEMLGDRGMNFTMLEPKQIETFIVSQMNKPGFEIVLGNQIRLVYYLAIKFRWSELKKMFENETTTYDLTILIIREKISQNNMKQLNALNIPFQVFLLKELQFNISKHILVPKHEVIRDPEEIKTIMDKLSLKSVKSKTQLPIIQRTDAMARWLNLRSGDIIKISRPSPTSGVYVTYRCCM